MLSSLWFVTRLVHVLFTQTSILGFLPVPYVLCGGPRKTGVFGSPSQDSACGCSHRTTALTKRSAEQQHRSEEEAVPDRPSHVFEDEANLAFQQKEPFGCGSKTGTKMAPWANGSKD